MPARFFRNLLMLSAWALITVAYARTAHDSLSGSWGTGTFDGGGDRSGNPASAAKDQLAKSEENFQRMQTQYGLQNLPQAAPALQAIQALIARAQQDLAAGNYSAVFSDCSVIDARTMDLVMLGKTQARQTRSFNSGPGGGPIDSAGMQLRMLNAKVNLDNAVARFNNFSQRLESGKAPCAADVLDKVRTALSSAQSDLQLGRFDAFNADLALADKYTPDLQNLVQEAESADKGTTAVHVSCNDPQTSTQAAAAQASEIYRRVLDRFTRATEQVKGTEDTKTQSVIARIQDLLDKAKEALASNQPEAAKEFATKAEAALPELHRSFAGMAEDRTSPAVWQRLKAKLDKAAEIVRASGSDKAAKILEKGQEHFDRAERDHSEGQSARAEVEMDIALKLAAKAVDIARSH